MADWLEHCVIAWLSGGSIPSAATTNSTSNVLHYLSMEFLPGRFLQNYIVNLKLREEVERAPRPFPFHLEELESQEWDAGLGNGGLGRLASCFLDSMATLNVPGYGCGIRYDYGIFHQTIENGWQVEHSDNWIRHGNPWEFMRSQFLYDVHFMDIPKHSAILKARERHQWSIPKR